ncbi:MAG TPA: phosphate ABC transporter permease subunit PstC [Gaiellaceae bacterium]|jgi:phosphate transport system permease protein|nr:phosphate ABC transporter permease subunit PstC [Gaiellaceae bacterium]
MSTFDATGSDARRPFTGRRARPGDLLLQGVAALAALGATVLVVLIAYKVVDGARLSLSTFGLGFLTHTVWDPVHGRFGAAEFLGDTALTSIGALVLATPLALGIALFLTELAPRWVRGPVTALVETLAAIPSVVIGLWGILVLGPVMRDHVIPALHSVLGFIPLFGPASTGSTVFTAIIVLTIMILPIVSSISRELFLGVPAELKEAAFGLGATRWEVVRGVMFPYARGGVAAAMILGLGRAVGEAIAVAQVIGAFDNGFSWNLGNPGDTLAAKIALDYQGATTKLEISSLFYLGVILLVFSLVVNLLAQWIVRRVSRRQGLAR